MHRNHFDNSLHLVRPIDSHKAAYIPACVAATHVGRVLTAEPATVLPVTEDEAAQSEPDTSGGFSKSNQGPVGSTKKEDFSSNEEAASRDAYVTIRESVNQAGALLRRSVGIATRLSVVHNSKKGIPPVNVTPLGTIREGQDGAMEYNFSVVEGEKDV